MRPTALAVLGLIISSTSVLCWMEVAIFEKDMERPESASFRRLDKPRMNQPQPPGSVGKQVSQFQ